MKIIPISFKEFTMLTLGLVLIYGLYYLRTHEQIFAPVATAAETVDTALNVNAATEVEPTANRLPPAVLETVEIPDWLDSKDDFDLTNLTAEDLYALAEISHQENHDFFPDNQNTLVYLLKAKQQGIESDEVEQLLTSLHASLYEQAELAISNYDAEQLTALTARLKSIDENDPNINPYTHKISEIYTLERLEEEVTEYIANNQLYEKNQNNAVSTLKSGLNIDANYQPLVELESHVLKQIQSQALRAAQELDFVIADEQISIMNELDSRHEITVSTITEIEAQKQNRFAYLDQQFYDAINNLNISRANNMMEELAELEIANSQMTGYLALLNKTQTYGPHEIGDTFNDLFNSGGNGPSMVVIPTGEYYMGSVSGPKHQRPRHLVQINYGLAFAKHEISVGEFQKFISATKYQTTAEKNNRAKIYEERSGRFKEKNNVTWRHDFLGKIANLDLPVIHVSWTDAKAYANWLSEQTGQAYRLPSESEFEYLLSANQSSVYPWGNEQPNQIWGNFSGAKDKFKRSRIRWREGFSNYQDGFWGPAPVGSFIQSLSGLFDLSGNVMEWVEDCWHDSYTRAPKNGNAWVNKGCENRVIRGGNWASANEEYQTHHRISAADDLTDPRLGFRVAKTFNY